MNKILFNINIVLTQLIRRGYDENNATQQLRYFLIDSIQKLRIFPHNNAV